MLLPQQLAPDGERLAEALLRLDVVSLGTLAHGQVVVGGSGEVMLFTEGFAADGQRLLPKRPRLPVSVLAFQLIGLLLQAPRASIVPLSRLWQPQHAAYCFQGKAGIDCLPVIPPLYPGPQRCQRLSHGQGFSKTA